jgi:hypothetical protein
VTAIVQKFLRVSAALFVLLGSGFLALLLMNGCADVYYAETTDHRAPEARFNTYYAPHYYPYYPWYSYYGGAYYYRE